MYSIVNHTSKLCVWGPLPEWVGTRKALCFIVPEAPYLGRWGYEVLCFDWESGLLPQEGEGHLEFPYLRWAGGWDTWISYLGWAGDTWSFLTWGGRGIREVLNWGWQGILGVSLPEVGGARDVLTWDGRRTCEVSLPEGAGNTWSSYLRWAGDTGSFLTWNGRGTRSAYLR